MVSRPVQTAIAALAAAASFSAFASAKDPLAVGANPEALTRGFGGKLYVSIMGETRTEGDGNGGITVIEDGVPKVFCGGMDDPKGIVMLGDFLVTTDLQRGSKSPARAGPGVSRHLGREDHRGDSSMRRTGC